MNIASQFFKSQDSEEKKRSNELNEFKEDFELLLSGGNEEGKKAIARAILSQTDERRRIGAMNPVDVCEELAAYVEGKFSRVDPADPGSAPIVKKEIHGILYSIVFYKSSCTFTIYNHDLYRSGLKSGIITTRNTPLGVKKALENIENKPL